MLCYHLSITKYHISVSLSSITLSVSISCRPINHIIIIHNHIIIQAYIQETGRKHQCVGLEMLYQNKIRIAYL